MNKNNNRYRAINQSPYESFEKIHSKERQGYKEDDYDPHKPKDRVVIDKNNFKCAQCGASVISDRSESGVNNRNHCPFCLWSRHVDMKTPGDRKALCKSRMEPVGITTKQTSKRYSRGCAGELMLVHQCTGCGKLSINRIAADDDAIAIYRVYERSLRLPKEIISRMHEQGILVLSAGDLTTVYSQLYGWHSILEEFTPSDSESERNSNELKTDEMVIRQGY
jgi:DNA-directed RNA polymerase subunit RPC12/RpoP